MNPVRAGHRRFWMATTGVMGNTRVMAATDPPEARPLTTARFDAVYDAHIDFVWRSVRRLGVPDAAADDVVQAILVVIFRRLDDFEGRSSIKTWVYEIVVRVVRDHRRTVRRKSPHASDRDPVDPAGLAAPADERPDAVADRADAARVVRELLDELDDDRREVFVLAELEQLTLREIAEVLHERPGTIASRLRAARAAFESAARRRRLRDQRRLSWTG
jgi:RNA polymerase sigma-70 factor, ECF subfamily